MAFSMCSIGETGELLRANPYVTVNWATHVDMETGRPVENPDKDFLNGDSQLDFAWASGRS